MAGQLLRGRSCGGIRLRFVGEAAARTPEPVGGCGSSERNQRESGRGKLKGEGETPTSKVEGWARGNGEPGGKSAACHAYSGPKC
jgi:hypothetical protein